MPGWFAMIAVSAALSALGHALRPRDRRKIEKREPDPLHPATLAEFEIPLAAEGRPISVIWGIVKIADPTVLWYGDLFTYQSGPQILHYYLGVHYGLCWGPVELLAIQSDDRDLPITIQPHAHHDEVVIDAPDIFGGYGNGGGLRGILHLYRGHDAQPPSEYLAAQLGRSVSGYPCLCHAVLASGIGAEVPFYVGERPVLHPMAWVLRSTPNELGLTGNRHTIFGDANPACMLYQILTDTRWGLAIPGDRIDRDSFIAAGHTLHSEEFGLSMRLSSTADARAVLEDILRHIDAVFIADPTTGRLCLRLIRFDYDPAAIPRFGPWNVLELTSFRRPGIEETANTVRLTYLDRSRFRARTVMVQDLANVQARGAVEAEPVEFSGISQRSVAQKVAARCLQMVAYPIASLTMRVNRSGFDLLQASPFVLDWPAYGIQDLVCRVTRVDHGSLLDEAIEVQAVEDVAAVGLAGYGPIPEFGWTDVTGEFLTPLWEIELPDLIYSTCEITDIDGDGVLEIVFLCWNNTVYVARPDGTIRYSRRFTSDTPEFDNAYGYVCAVDVNGDGRKEIIFGSHDGHMRCLSYDLETVLWTVPNWYARNSQPPAWPAETFFQNGPTPAVCDVGGVPTLCLFFTGFDGYLVCVRAATGEILWEHDTSVGGNSDIETAPAVKDIDGDGQPEIVIVALNTCQRLEHSGPPVTWKYDHTQSPSSDYNTSTASIADINNDGLDEILFTGGHWTPEHGREESLFVLSRDGVCLSRLALAYGGSCDTQPIVCDPTGSAGKMVFLADDNGYVYGLRWDAGGLEKVWARKLSELPINNTPCLLDVNGDGVKEVVIGTAEARVHVLNARTGTVVQTIALDGATDIEGTITGADIDGDGRVEVLVPARELRKLMCYRGRRTFSGNALVRWGGTEGRTGEV